MKQIILSILLFCSISTFGQNEVTKIVIAIANKKDTLSIKHFDASNNLVFLKSFPKSDNGAEIYTYLYDNSNREIRKFYFSGTYDIINYQYDTVQNIRKAFTYEYIYEDENDFSSKKFISKIHNVKDLEETETFKKIIKQDEYLAAITYFMDTLPVKTINFNREGDTTEIINYSYNDRNLLVSEYHHFKKTAYSMRPPLDYREVYTYDTLGKILSFGHYYLYRPMRPVFLFKYDYETPNIIKVTFEGSDGKIRPDFVEEYENDRIVKRIDYYYPLSEKKEKKSISYTVIYYEYDEENRLVREFYSKKWKEKPLKKYRKDIEYIYKLK